MPDFSVTAVNSRLLRQLKLLVALLFLSNIGLGIFGIYVLRTIDQRYSALIAQTVPSLNDLQTLTALETDAMRNTNPTLFVESQNLPKTIERARETIQRDRDLRKRTLQRHAIAAPPEKQLTFEEAGEAFSQKATEVVALLAAKENAGATQLREQSLRPLFDHYIAATTKFADAVQEQSLRTSDQLSVQSGSLSRVLLGLATWPMMLLAVFFLLAALFVLGVLVKVMVFRGAET